MSTSQSDKYRTLQELSEAEFRQDALIPLLKKMGYTKVRERHGPQEYGKDITFYEASEFGGMHYAVVAKTGDISGAASGKRNLRVIKTQIDQAFTMPFEDVEEKRTSHIDKVVVWTTGRISNNAERQIVTLADERFKYVIFRNGEATIELLEEHYPAFFTIRDPVLSGYYESVSDYYSSLEELRTLGASPEKRHLPVIFVSPTFSEIIPRQGKQYGIDAKKKVYTLQAVQNMKENLVILGDAGSGKTTLLRKMLLNVVEQNSREAKREPIPVLIESKDLVFSEEHPIEALLQKEFLRFCPDNPEGDLEVSLENGSMIVLLDGLDELENKGQIEEAMIHIEDFSAEHRRTRVIITSRFMGILEQRGTLPGFRMFKINNLNTTQMVRFVQNWYGPETDICQKLVKLVNRPGNLGGLPATPLTLTLVAILHENSPWQEIPANKTELFSKYIELALGRWDASKDLSIQFEYKIKKFVLQQISWDLHQRKTFEISPQDFETWIELLSEEYGLRIDAEIFRREVIERSELIFRNEEDEYQFKHRSFQDYFVGAEINRQPESTDFVVSRILDPWWASAIFFAGGLRPDNQEYIQAILKQTDVPDSQASGFAINLGELVQATFMSTKKTKSNAVTTILDSLLTSWENTYQMWQELEDKPEITKDIPAHLLFLTLHVGIAQLALGSVTLASVLSDLTKVYIREFGQIHLEDERAILEWRAFFLAMACAECENTVPEFLDLFESGLIAEPSFVLFGSWQAENLMRREWIERKHLKRVKSLFKSLSKEWKGSIEYRKYLKKVEILSFSPKGTEKDD